LWRILSFAPQEDLNRCLGLRELAAVLWWQSTQGYKTGLSPVLTYFHLPCLNQGINDFVSVIIEKG
jgi:hypothetical protein